MSEGLSASLTESAISASARFDLDVEIYKLTKDLIDAQSQAQHMAKAIEAEQRRTE